jgi:hypothetical protein
MMKSDVSFRGFLKEGEEGTKSAPHSFLKVCVYVCDFYNRTGMVFDVTKVPHTQHTHTNTRTHDTYISTRTRDTHTLEHAVSLQFYLLFAVYAVLRTDGYLQGLRRHEEWMGLVGVGRVSDVFEAGLFVGNNCNYVALP